MNKFDEREKSFEKKFAHDEELQFKVSARKNKYLGQSFLPYIISYLVKHFVINQKDCIRNLYFYLLNTLDQSSK